MKHVSYADLKHKISFLKNSSTKSLSPIWITNYVTNAFVTPMDEKSYQYIENFNFGQLLTISLYIFKIRFTNKISIKDRIQFGIRLFNIKKITNVEEKNITLTIVAAEHNC